MKRKGQIYLFVAPVLLASILFTAKQTGSPAITAKQTHAPVALSSGVDTAWVRHYAGEPIPGIDRAVDVALDHSGNICVTGYMTSAKNGYDYYTIKYNSSGSQIWSARYDGKSGADVPVGICVDEAGNVYVTGTSGHDFATIKYDASGAEQWVARYNCPANAWSSVAGIAVDDSGNVFIAGTIEISNTNAFYVILKYDPFGKEKGVARYDARWGSGDEVAALALDSFGNVYVTGSNSTSSTWSDYATIKYNSAGVLQWAVRFNGPGNNSDKPAGLAVDASGNVYVTGSSTLPAGGANYVTIKYDGFGTQQWAAIHDGSDGTPALAIDDSGNVFVTGTSWGANSSSDYVTIKYNASGVEEWVARYNGPGNSEDKVTAFALDRLGNVYVIGSSGGLMIGDDFATIKYNANGIEQWVARYNGPDSTADIPTAIAVDESGAVYVTGAGDIHYMIGMPIELYCNYATVKYDPSGVEQWVAHYDGPGEIHATASEMAIDEAGNVYVTGYCPGEYSRRGWSADYVTIQYDAAGAVQWIARCQEGSQAARLVLDDSGNAYVTGFGDGGGYITVRYNASGETQWVAHCNRDVVAGYSWPGFPWQISLAVDRSGNVYVAGGVNITNDNSDYIIIKYDHAGNEQWAMTYDGPRHFFDEANAVAVDDSGNVYVTGTSHGNGADIATIKYNNLGIEQWVARFDGPGTGPANNWDMASDMAIDRDGNVYVTGRTRSAISGEDFVTIKYNASGVSQWIAHYSGGGWDEATALALDNASNVYVTGLSNGCGDFATVKYNNSGEQQWVARYSSSAGRSYDFPYDLTLDASGNVYVTGFGIDLRDDADFATIKYNPSGAEQWIAHYNGSGNSYDEAWCVAVDGAGNVHVAGTSSGGNWSIMTMIKYVESPTTVATQGSDALPAEYSLAQNYPNPFNPTTTIEFALPQASFVTLKIYDLLGNEVATLVAEKLPAGTHQRVWEAKGLASGVYLYRLQAGDPSAGSGQGFVQTKKLALLR
ncbi:MAG: hypothetical protein DKINENOH_05402 [bacterium]|nr:hypothetical protein [bacterium]